MAKKNSLKTPEPEKKEKPVKEKRSRSRNANVVADGSTDAPKKERKPLKFALKTPDWVQDDRFQKIAGGLFMMFSFYLLISFTSYLFTWQNDQDKIDDAGIFSFLSADVKVENWLGKLGAILSHLFVGRWFGIASFLFVLNFFVIGFKGVAGAALLPIKKMIKLSALFMVITSIALGFVVHTTGFVFIGGAFGYEMNEFLNLSIGRAGTAILLSFTAFVIIVIYYNPSFKRKPKTVLAEGEEIDPIKMNTYNPIKEDQITKDEKLEVNFNKKGKVEVIEESDEEEEEDQNENESDEEEEDILTQTHKLFIFI